MEKIITAMYWLIALLIVLILRMIRIERQLRLKMDLKTCQNLFTLQDSNTKTEIANSIGEVNETLEGGLTSIGGVFAYESYCNKRLLSDSLIVNIDAYGKTNFLDVAIDSLNELIDIMIDFEIDLSGEKKLVTGIQDFPSIEELREDIKYYQEKLEKYLDHKEKITSIGR